MRGRSRVLGKGSERSVQVVVVSQYDCTDVHQRQNKLYATYAIMSMAVCQPNYLATVTDVRLLT